MRTTIRAIAVTICVIIASAVMPAVGHAWGNHAHKIICEIAFQEMSRPARDGIKKLIAEDDQYSMFAESIGETDSTA